MARKPMKIADRIKRFIDRKNPTRKEILMYLIIDIYKRETKKTFNYSEYRGQYSTNFTKWRETGNVQVDPKTKRYSLTKEGKANKKSLYSMPIENKLKVEIERRKRAEASYDKIKEGLLSRLDNLKRNLNDTNNEIDQLKQSVEWGVVRHY